MVSDSKEKLPLLQAMPESLKPPPPLIQPGVGKLDTPTTISLDTVFPKPLFTKYRLDARKQRLPQCIAHRGYKANFPENTLAAFRGAVDAGVHALETDVHVTKDEVVVLSHDADMKRCFGVEKKIKDMSWEEVKECKTLKEPKQSMPQLRELLEYMAQPGLEETWLLLDIKLDNDADQIMRLLGSTIAAVPAPAKKAWHERVVLGLWAAKYLPLATDYLPGFPVTHIGFSVSYARHFFTVPNVSFNILLPMLIAPGGRSFIKDAQQKHHRQMYAWTVNERDKMEWCIRRKLDGVITDDPALFLRVCEEFDESKKELWMPLRLRGYVDVARIYLMVVLLGWWFLRRFRGVLKPVASPGLIRKVARPQLKN